MNSESSNVTSPPYPHTQPPPIAHLLPWALKCCPTCVRITSNNVDTIQLAPCPLLHSIAQSIIVGTAMDVTVLELIDPSWMNLPRHAVYKLPEHCHAFVATC
jgi:hypothetical protein